jgi:hypothetical protein
MSAKRRTFFKDRLIRFTQPRALNDPFEMRPHIIGFGTPAEMLEIAVNRWELFVEDQYQQYVSKQADSGAVKSFKSFRAELEPLRQQEIMAALHRAPEYTPLMIEHIDKMINLNVGVLSLCERPDIGLMWSHYADSHYGFLIEFDTGAPFFNQIRPPSHLKLGVDDEVAFAQEYGRLRAIDYQEIRPSVNVTEMTFEILLTKGKDWQYEKEWRMLMPPEYADVTRKDPKGLPLYLFEIPPSAIKAILLGCNADPELVFEALAFREVSENKIRVEKGVVDERHFRINFEAVI